MSQGPTHPCMIQGPIIPIWTKIPVMLRYCLRCMDPGSYSDVWDTGSYRVYRTLVHARMCGTQVHTEMCGNLAHAGMCGNLVHTGMCVGKYPINGGKSVESDKLLTLKTIMEPHHEKTCSCHMWTTKAQISLSICTDWSAPLLFAA